MATTEIIMWFASYLPKGFCFNYVVCFGLRTNDHILVLVFSLDDVQ